MPGKERSRHSGREQAIGKENEQKDQAKSSTNKLLSDIKQNVQPQEGEVELITIQEEEEPEEQGVEILDTENEQEVEILDRQNEPEVEIVYDQGPPPRETNLTIAEMEEREIRYEEIEDGLLNQINRKLDKEREKNRIRDQLMLIQMTERETIERSYLTQL